jgi:hypothetical protein
MAKREHVLGSGMEWKLRLHGFEKHLWHFCSQVADVAGRKDQLSMLGRF